MGQDNLISFYKEYFNLHQSSFNHIEHADALVATVYLVKSGNKQFVLKICSRPSEYAREVYFLNKFADTLPVPRIIQTCEPQAHRPAAILMEYITGQLMSTVEITPELAYSMGKLLAQIHANRTHHYGDIAQNKNLTDSPETYFAAKFEENFEECAQHLPKNILEHCRRCYEAHHELLSLVDGPCITHRDFRPGNIIVRDNKIQAIIDWSSSQSSFAEEDFCVIEHGPQLLIPALKQSFLNGYASIRAIPDYSIIMPLLRINRALAVIGFLLKRNLSDHSHKQLYDYNHLYLENLIAE